MTSAPTIQDVAMVLGMHKSTVSLALSGKGNVSEDTRIRVRSVAEQLGYAPNPLAQRLATGHRNPAISIVGGVLDVGLATEKVLLIQRELTLRFCEAPIYTCSGAAEDSGEAQAAQIRRVCRQRPRAIVCAVQMLSPLALRELEDYQRAGGTVVSYDIPNDLACDQVVFHREDNAYRGARYLLDHGHRHIGVGMSKADGPAPASTSLPNTFRLRGFERAFREFPEPVQAEWFFSNATYEKCGVEMAYRFLGMDPRPTGVCIVNDYVALAFMVELMRSGVRIPDDVSVVGHDDQPIAPFCPVPLTCMSQPTNLIADAVCALLLDRLAGKTQEPRTVTVTGTLVERGSVGRTIVSNR